MHPHRALLALTLFCSACFEAGEVDIKDDTSAPETSDSEPDTEAGAVTVSGTANRTYDTCPPTGDFQGTLCLFLAAECEDIGGAAATAEVQDADMYMPTDIVDWAITGVANGSWQLWAFLDDDASGCTEPSYNDLTSECQAVEVVEDADVPDLSVSLVSKCSE